MSGGSLNYFYSELEDHANDLGDKELNHLVRDLAELFHDREWYLSADIGEGTWNESVYKFKNKWFSKHGRQQRIEQYLAEFADEIRRTFGISTHYCKNCSHFTPEKKGEYGKCDFEDCCLTHRSDSCDKFEPKQEVNDHK